MSFSAHPFLPPFGPVPQTRRGPLFPKKKYLESVLDIQLTPQCMSLLDIALDVVYVPFFFGPASRHVLSFFSALFPTPLFSMVVVFSAFLVPNTRLDPHPTRTIQFKNFILVSLGQFPLLVLFNLIFRIADKELSRLREIAVPLPNFSPPGPLC